MICKPNCSFAQNGIFLTKTFYSLSIVLFIASNLLRFPQISDGQIAIPMIWITMDLIHLQLGIWQKDLTKNLCQKQICNFFKYAIENVWFYRNKNSCKRCFLHPCRLSKSKILDVVGILFAINCLSRERWPMTLMTIVV